jgi:hypothetical protein
MHFRRSSNFALTLPNGFLIHRRDETYPADSSQLALTAPSRLHGAGAGFIDRG